ncbi:plasmid-partitioning protein [Escherichia coli]|uniref:ParB/RepB/Spo0J family plasmid partition protein n=1 Tax=Escherichia coli TaxID=562 RepID=UPI000589F8A8|nr:ParB/RepB/Spo0J family plasmid partition protein [Escherichia coli]EAC1404449.1 ParB/RepB/Spo0J family plasmid partition protein [Escherichia coli]EEW6031797.1 ParB/RepB/Spo0J family plasmid partition protein [Escherichia coli]EFC4873385.1 ParB/RepB/Spo0J family plasmid partition protein [Escherichia coli]EFN9261281.1 ParB/RepB/Spo0J family plasmid partition protein [Escherichia coli]EGK3604501.1 ParB/RepB/Spo0J family plasmid partition protein [Escherichia coli]
MKRAPLIPKITHSESSSTPADTPAAPVVDTLIARVGTMAKGNSIVLPVNGHEVKFVLEIIAGKDVQQKTSVWGGNERDQELLNEWALDDLLPSFQMTGQQNPAFGRRVDGMIEVADGSRRRMAAIMTLSDYRILVGDLNDAQMDTLCKLGNDYRPTSAYERGNRYQRRLDTEFEGNISALSEAENISRKIINRCLNTARLPKEVVMLFSHPGELSARAGELLYKTFEKKERIMLEHAQYLADKKAAGVIFEADELIESFHDLLKSDINRPPVVKREFRPGAIARYKGNKVTLTLDRTRISEDCIARIEAILVSE